MKTYELTEIKRIVSGGTYRHAGLFRSDGECLISYNSLVNDLPKKLKEIESRLKSDGLPDAIYIIRAKNVNKKDAIPDQFIYKKGNAEISAPVVTAEKKNLSESSHSVLSWDNALKLTTENAQLKSQVELLTKENTFLKERIDEIEEQLSEDEEEEEPNSLLEGGKSLLEGLLPTILPLAEQHFAFKDRELKLKEIQQQFEMIKFQKGNGLSPGAGSPGSPGSTEEQIPDAKEDPIRFMQYLAKLAQTNPSKYEEIISTFKTA